MRVTINPARGLWHAPGHGVVSLKWAAHAECGCSAYVAWDYVVGDNRLVVLVCGNPAHREPMLAFNRENEESRTDPALHDKPAITVAADQMERHLTAAEEGS